MKYNLKLQLLGLNLTNKIQSLKKKFIFYLLCVFFTQAVTHEFSWNQNDRTSLQLFRTPLSILNSAVV